MSCEKFECGYDKFALIEIGNAGAGCTYYLFDKKIEDDIIHEQQSLSNPNGYRLYGETSKLGQWDYVMIGHDGHYKNMAISAYFLCWPNSNMTKVRLHIYFNYTVASTGERREEVWEVDFGQKPYEDRRDK